MHPSEVVDLGCGCGLLAHLALHSAAPASSATAVEIAPHLARLAQRLLPGDRVPWQHLVARWLWRRFIKVRSCIILHDADSWWQVIILKIIKNMLIIRILEETGSWTCCPVLRLWSYHGTSHKQISPAQAKVICGDLRAVMVDEVRFVFQLAWDQKMTCNIGWPHTLLMAVCGTDVGIG